MSYDGNDIVENDCEAMVAEDRELDSAAHSEEEAPKSVCQYWAEHDCDGSSKVEYCNKECHVTVCGGDKAYCTIKEAVMEEKSVVVKDAIVMPAVTPEKAVEAFEAYQSLAKKIMTADDIQKIQGKDFKKKSFWRKCQRFFNLSVEIVKEEREVYDGYFVYKFIVRATAPNGAHMDGTGTCSSDEKGMLKTEHNTRAIAETRAKNRAISDLVAFGEVSAEEVNGDEEHETKPEPSNTKTSDYKLMTSKYDSKCKACGEPISKGDEIAYSKEKGVFHPACVS